MRSIRRIWSKSFFNIRPAPDVCFQKDFIHRLRNSPYRCVLALREQKTLSDMLKIAEPSGVSFKILGDPVERFNRSV
jgi:hypothetical protein